MILKLRGELLVRKIVLGNDEQPGRVLVDAVDNAGAQRAAHAGERVAAVVQQGVDERPLPVPRGGVHDQTLGLVDDDHVRVLIRNVQRNILRLRLRRLRLGERQHQHVAGGDAGVFLCRRAVEQYLPVLAQPLRGAAGDAGRKARDARVHALVRAVRQDRHGWRPFSVCRTKIRGQRSECTGSEGPPGR